MEPRTAPSSFLDCGASISEMASTLRQKDADEATTPHCSAIATAANKKRDGRADDRNGFDKPALLYCGWRRMAPQPVWSGVNSRRLASGSPDTASQRPGLLRYTIHPSSRALSFAAENQSASTPIATKSH